MIIKGNTFSLNDNYIISIQVVTALYISNTINPTDNKRITGLYVTHTKGDLLVGAKIDGYKLNGTEDKNYYSKVEDTTLFTQLQDLFQSN